MHFDDDYFRTPENQALIDAEQVVRNVEIMEAAEIEEPYAFTTNIFCQISLPHRGKKNEVYRLVRRNGTMTVVMNAGGTVGLPYGYYARMILCWLVRTACIRNASMEIDDARTIPLDGSILQMMREAGVLRPGKRPGAREYEAFKDQFRRIRLMTMSIEFTGGKRPGIELEAGTNTSIVEEWELEWDMRAQEIQGESYIVLSLPFFKQVINHAVPLNPAHLAQFARSPLAFDLYTWLAYRLYGHSGTTHITWQQIRDQLGAGYPDTDQGMRDFKKKVRKALDTFATAWPEAKNGVSEWRSANNSGLRLAGKATPVDRVDGTYDFNPPADF